jgi:DtxR family transcriptional regulator, Mn-dependent transcriptional regulator
MVTSTMRRYAAEIYRLQEDRAYVPLSDLVEPVNASHQAIARMVSRLKERGYVEHEPYRGVRLTPAGEAIAMPAIRRHRVVEVFLVKVLGFGWEEVHEASDRFELGVDDAIEERLFEAAGRPRRCPHGEPIPGKDGKMPAVDDASLVEMKSGTSYRLSRVRIHEPEKLRYLGELGLYPGVCLLFLSQAPFRGPLRLRREKDEIVLSHELAKGLLVEAGCAQGENQTG